MSIKEAFSYKEFYLLWLCLLFGGLGLPALDIYKAFGQTFLDDDEFLAMIGAFAGIFNSGGRLVWGFLGDRYTFKVSKLFDRYRHEIITDECKFAKNMKSFALY